VGFHGSDEQADSSTRFVFVVEVFGGASDDLLVLQSLVGFEDIFDELIEQSWISLEILTDF
jgi:hypothetical protein